ncbi:nectin-1-like isoform X2 [Notolabrus celidotus]|uniref:nectin-1-like isoform X2 n=1 Tax=Notolabrus celidotus TaxID=1203425 RepID=UPI00148FD625|nr:nectin-1-like isoform X2 [Notolabrus celidotus]
MLRFPRRMTMFFLGLMLILNTVSDALQVIGGSTTVEENGTIVFPCKIIDTTEALSQISWQRLTRVKVQKDNFYTISEKGPKFVNGIDDRFEFAGDFTAKIGDLMLSNVKVLDEGNYTCIFTMFPSGNHETTIPLTVLVPPVSTLKETLLTFGNEEVLLATCTAVRSKPPAEVTWLTDGLTVKVRTENNSTLNDDGTTTTVSGLYGVPTREISNHSVQCTIYNADLRKRNTLPFTIKVHSPPLVNITERSANQFECQTEGFPTPVVTWSRSGQSMLPSGVRVEAATLQFLSTTSDLNGLYHCKANNPYGSQRGDLYVYFTSGLLEEKFYLLNRGMPLLLLPPVSRYTTVA